MFVSAILAAGGRGARMGARVPKQLLMIGNRSILQRSFDTLEAHDAISEIVVALPRGLALSPPSFLKSSRKPVHVVDGGERRQDSVANAFSRVSNSADYVVIHDAARPFASAALLERVIDAARSSPGDAAIAALRASDTVKQVAERREALPVVARTLSRDSIYLAQTPQVFLRRHLAEAIERGRGSSEATDEATLVERAGHPVSVVDGEPANIKVTTEQDLRVADALIGQSDQVPNHRFLVPRIGVGYDLHRLEPGRKLIIGGVDIPYGAGLAGHSDADVLCHALTDAILGAACEGDIGQHFPDSDPRWKDADSVAMLTRACNIVQAAGFVVANVDAVVIAQLPKLAPHVEAIRSRLAAAIGIDVRAVSVKGKTNEAVGALGRNEAIAVHAVALLIRSRESGV
jgi:2-C-methyl-D-erythritol 4-phosphate cytidylyltransferase / 2-C-methyl-D-erythritol 2,4-cyclodiphosphate synthase